MMEPSFSHVNILLVIMEEWNCEGINEVEMFTFSAPSSLFPPNTPENRTLLCVVEDVPLLLLFVTDCCYYWLLLLASTAIPDVQGTKSRLYVNTPHRTPGSTLGVETSHGGGLQRWNPGGNYHNTMGQQTNAVSLPYDLEAWLKV